jgi:dihydrofolate reductase
MQLHLIFAKARNGVIGKDNALPWHLPQDLAHFKQLTMGCPVIMGRKTWDSLPPRFRPLPGRTNVVLTRQPNWSENGAEPASNIANALSICEQSAHAWVIGGAELYTLAMPYAHSAEVTEIDADFDGDAFAPTFGPHWVETACETHTSSHGWRFSFVSYRNLQPHSLIQGS